MPCHGTSIAATTFITSSSTVRTTCAAAGTPTVTAASAPPTAAFAATANLTATALRTSARTTGCSVTSAIATTGFATVASRRQRAAPDCPAVAIFVGIGANGHQWRFGGGGEFQGHCPRRPPGGVRSLGRGALSSLCSEDVRRTKATWVRGVAVEVTAAGGGSGRTRTIVT